MARVIDSRTLRSSDSTELATYFRNVLNEVENKKVSDHLLAGIRSEALPPSIIPVWLSGYANNGSLVTALYCDYSVSVRKNAIKQFGRRLRKPSFSNLWHAVGETEGLIELFAKLSVQDVDRLCRALVRSGTSGANRNTQQQHLTELLRGLASKYFPESAHHNPDSRPLLESYATLVPACTPDMVLAWVENELLPQPSDYRLYQAHPELFQEQCVQKLTNSKGEIFKLEVYEPLLHSLPPTPAIVDPLISESMHFSLKMLDTIAQDSNLNIIPVRILYDITLPLLQRLERRQSDQGLKARVLRTFTSCSQARPELCEKISLKTFGVVGYAIRLWRQNPDQYEGLLVDLIQLLPRDQSYRLSMVAALLDQVPRGIRWRLLALLLQHLRTFNLNISKDDDIQKFRNTWPVRIFLSLSRQDARYLLEKLMRFSPEDKYLDWDALGRYNSIFRCYDIDPLNLYIRRGEDEVQKIARDFVDKQKRNASTSREQSDRVDMARLAVFCGVAANSFELVEDTLLWARRFNKDALTAKGLYSQTAMHTVEFVELLSGLSTPCSSLDQIKRLLGHGNRIMLLLLETACQSLKEPSFYQRDWQPVLDLFDEVTSQRMRRAPSIQQRFRLSDQQVYDLVWQPTLEVLIQAEQVGLLKDHEKLGFNRMHGPFPSYRHDAAGQAGWPTPAACRFVDNLAQRRNELWGEHRRTNYPAVVTLPEPWPRGLSIQSIFPGVLGRPGSAKDMPYLYARAKAIVFIDPSTALSVVPKDEETRRAIGPFVNNYFCALELYVNAQSPKSEQHRCLLEACDYVLDKLTGTRMQEVEARRFWRSEFHRAEVRFSPTIERMPKLLSLLVPQLNDGPFELLEWNPDPAPRSWTVRTQQLEPLCLDYMRVPSYPGNDTVNGDFMPGRSEANAYGQPYEEFLQRPKSVYPEMKEALIAAALLFIDGKQCSGNDVFPRPFPSHAHMRYPAMFLDDEFLDLKGLKDSFGMDALRAFREDIPPSLLVVLVRTMLDSAGTDHEQFRLLKLLAESDKPELALKLAQHVIIDRPDDSSWHRHVLTTGLLERLPSTLARDFLSRVSTAMIDKLQQQSERKVAAGIGDGPPRPLVKVSTVKMLAQLMSGTSVVDDSAKIDILITIFKRSNHLDVRVTLVESLISTLQATKNEQVKTTIFDALETYAVPIAASVNERHPLTDEEWRRAEVEGVVPEIYRPGPDPFALPPLLNALSWPTRAARADEALTRRLIDRVLLPVLRQSISNNRRWLESFLRVNDFPAVDDDLLSVPTTPRFLSSLVVHNSKFVPQSVLDLLASTIVANLRPRDHVKEINTTILSSASLRSSNAGMHWLALFHNLPKRALLYGGGRIDSLLTDDFTSALPDGISHGRVMEIVFEQAKLVVEDGDMTRETQQHLLDSLAPPFRKNEEYWRRWNKYSRPLLTRVADMIDNLRTEQWKRDPNRSPAVLPDTYRLRLWLLAWPACPWQSDHQAKLDVFASEVIDEVTYLVENYPKYHDKFNELKSMLLKAWPQDYCFLACRLGRLEPISNQMVPLAGLLRVELADQFLKLAEEPKHIFDVEETRQVLADWKQSRNEDVRMRGIKTTKKLSDTARGEKTGWFNRA